MSYNASRRAREKRLRAKYRKKICSTGISMLIVGLILGIAVCVVAVQHSDRVAELIIDLSPSKALDFVTPTPSPMPVIAAEIPTFGDDEPEPTKELVAAPTLAIVEVQEVPATPVATETPEDEPASALSISEPEATQIAVMMPVETSAIATAEPTPEPVEVPEEASVDIAEIEIENEPDAVTVAELSEEPTAEPTPEPTVEPTPVPAAEPIIVPYGEACTLQTQIKADGSARRTADDDAYETLNLTLKVNAYKDPAYFEAHYADSYNLQGNEAAVEFDITLNGYEGSAQIIPQNFLLITFCSEDQSVTSQGFQLMDTEIAGKTDIAIASDTPATLYKRYPYNADQGDMTYMLVNTYNDGVEGVYLFEILAPAPAETPAPTADIPEGGLTVGSKGEEVKKLQRVLIDNGLLTGEPDGHFGNYTAGAVKEMQRRFGMEQTGVADQAFLDKLYS